MRKWTNRLLVFCLFSMGIGWAGTTWVSAKSNKEPLRIETLPTAPLPSTELLRKGTRLRAPSGVWTWFDIPKTRCGYGKRTGMAINPSPQVNSKTLVIMLQGGGACWKEKAAMGGCFSVPRTAFGLKGINKKTFRTGWRVRRVRRAFVLQRGIKKNPLKNAHYAFLPYCTGDLHVGNTKVTFSKGRTMYFHGHANMLAYIKRLVPTFHKVKHVILAGVSAGGVGASLHWQRVQRAFGPKVRVDLLNDSGTPLNPPKKRWQAWLKHWQPKLPKGCKECKKGIVQILNYYKKTMFKRDARMAFLGHTEDRVIRTFLGLNFFGKAYHSRLKVAMKRLDKLPKAQYFVLPGGSHVVFFRRNAHKIKGNKGKGPTLANWINQFVNHTPKWQSVKP